MESPKTERDRQKLEEENDKERCECLISQMSRTNGYPTEWPHFAAECFSADTAAHHLHSLSRSARSLQLSCSVSAIPEANLRALQKPSVVSDQSQQIRSSYSWGATKVVQGVIVSLASTTETSYVIDLFSKTNVKPIQQWRRAKEHNIFLRMPLPDIYEAFCRRKKKTTMETCSLQWTEILHHMDL